MSATIGHAAKDDPLDGWRLTQAIVVMVNAVFKAGGTPVKVVMHPNDFLAMKDENGERLTLLMIAGLPIDINAECPPGKIYALQEQTNPTSNRAS